MFNDEEVLGFEIPIHRSLTQPILMGGVPREFAILLGTLTTAMVMGMHTVWILPFSLIGYLAMLSACKVDPQIMKVFQIYWKQPQKMDL